MGKMTFSAEGPVGAPAGLVYELLRDYRTHHPRILPPAFSPLTVEEGASVRERWCRSALSRADESGPTGCV